jgi:hypothetical protein
MEIIRNRKDILNDATKTGGRGLGVQGAPDVALVEEGDDFVAFLEASYFRSDGDDFACSVL